MSADLQASKVLSLQNGNESIEDKSLKDIDCKEFSGIYSDGATYDYSLLEDVAEVIDSLHKTPSYTSSGFPMVRVTDVKYGELQLDKTLKVDEATFSEFSRRYAPNSGDIVITRVGTYGVSAQVKDINFCLGQNTAAIIPKSINKRYLYATLNSSFLRDQIESSIVGSTQKTLSLKCIKALKIPRLNEVSESAIAELIGALDDRIALLRETNATLEAIAQALFKSWFVDFDPVHANAGTRPATLPPELQALFPSTFTETPQGLVPEGWTVKQLGDVAAYLNRGISPKYIDDGGVLVINQKCIRDFAVDLSKARRHDPVQRKIDGRTLELGDILVNSTGVGTLGRVAQILEIKDTMIVDSHVTAVRANSELSWPYLGQALMRKQPEIEEMGEGTTGQTELARSKLALLPVICPSREVLAAFDDIVVPLKQALASKAARSKILATLRDTLLPRLISGQLRLPEAEALIVEEGV